MDWYVVDKKYIKYLTQFDSRVGYVEYGGERLKLHVGIILTVGEFHYYVPISSAKPKHQKMSNSLDFHKLQDKTTGYLYAVLNINNMIPVPDNCLTQLKYNQVTNFRSFSNETEKTNYIYLPCNCNEPHNFHLSGQRLHQHSPTSCPCNILK
jgi:protein AbiQ